MECFICCEEEELEGTGEEKADVSVPRCHLRQCHIQSVLLSRLMWMPVVWVIT